MGSVFIPVASLPIRTLVHNSVAEAITAYDFLNSVPPGSIVACSDRFSLSAETLLELRLRK